jgi:hypothetical protein
VRIAKTGKPHSSAENLILAALKDVKIMFSDKLLKDIDLIPLSNESVSRRINDIAGNMAKEGYWFVSFICTFVLHKSTHVL